MAKKSSALGRLVECIEIKNADGTTTMVPISSEDNSRSNKILASQVRTLLQENIKSYSGKIMTPKELKELAEAAKSVAEFSGEVYKSGDTMDDGKTTKKAGAVQPSPETDDIKFDVLISSQKQPSQQEQLQKEPEESSQEGV
jgi:hypothetical protein